MSGTQFSFLKSDQIKRLDISLSSRCNASCPMCRRNVYGGKKLDDLPLTDMSLIDIQEKLTPKLLGQLEAIYVCGDFGESTLAPDCLEILDYISRKISLKCTFVLDTNGGTKEPVWWKSLASIFNSSTRFVNFAIDGLEFTNSIYRRGVKWSLLMNNVKSFLGAGGFGDWCFIPFGHNEEQINEAMDLSKALGFQRFTLRLTNRFRGKEKYPIADKKGQIESHLYPPKSQSLQHSTLLDEDLEDVERYIETTEINCKFQRHDRVTLGFDGRLFPCCYIAATAYGEHPFAESWKRLLRDSGGDESLRGPIGEVVEGPFFSRLVESWGCSSMENGRQPICGFFCGQRSPQLKKEFFDPQSGDKLGDNWCKKDKRYNG